MFWSSHIRSFNNCQYFPHYCSQCWHWEKLVEKVSHLTFSCIFTFWNQLQFYKSGFQGRLTQVLFYFYFMEKLISSYYSILDIKNLISSLWKKVNISWMELAPIKGIDKAHFLLFWEISKNHKRQNKFFFLVMVSLCKKKYNWL